MFLPAYNPVQKCVIGFATFHGLCTALAMGDLPRLRLFFLSITCLRKLLVSSVASSITQALQVILSALYPVARGMVYNLSPRHLFMPNHPCLYMPSAALEGETLDFVHDLGRASILRTNTTVDSIYHSDFKLDTFYMAWKAPKPLSGDSAHVTAGNPAFLGTLVRKRDRKKVRKKET